MTRVADTLKSTGGSVGGCVRVPGDKSISHRAALIAAMSAGQSELHGYLFAEDCLATLHALRECGIDIEVDVEQERVIVRGRGNRGFETPRRPLDFGNSGTGLRLTAGVLAGRGIAATLTGDASLCARPMNRIVEPLAALGADVSATAGCAPLTIRPAKLQGRRFELSVASAQVKSCLLFAGLHATGQTTIVAPPSRSHTEHLLRHFGVPVQESAGEISVQRCNWDAIPGRSVNVPGDPSSAAFLAVAAAIAPQGSVELPGVGVSPGRTGFIDVLRRMGVEVSVQSTGTTQGEPVADLTVHAGHLNGVDIGPDEIPGLIDELPVLLIAAACAEGETTVRGAEELRVKESDRLSAMAVLLRGLGAGVEEFPDGIRVTGRPELHAATVDAKGDHRIAMAALIAGVRSRGPITVRGCAQIATSFPGFVGAARSVGMEVDEA